mmetsp:Transcript_70876/g.117758  ORF Transcript_70876/g.117758 Transcript_70876/m.117758 type:complete len:114 (+) Transcript_70876:1-342(+)
MENFSDWLVQLLRERLPLHARVLAIVDENLAIEDSNVTLSGSHAIQLARDQLTPSEESRLLAVVRSANDSPADLQLYSERAHGFLSKAPIEPDKQAIARLWYKTFGTNCSLST